MKVLLLASLSSAHTIKWANGLAMKGCSVVVCGLNSNFDKSQYSSAIKLVNIKFPEKILISKKGSLNKILYLAAMPRIKKIIKQYKPDLLHAHYASSYGLLGMLTGFHPYIVSVWGSDIFTFPKGSLWKSAIIRTLFNKADKILSTSNFMVAEIKKYTDKQILVTPFGIDTEQFMPRNVESIFRDEEIVLGTIKSLEPQYGIEYLLKAFKIVKENNPKLPLKLLIVGGGSLEKLLKNLAVELNISNDTDFIGFVKYSEIKDYHNMIDIYVALSVFDDESFGVAILEAGASEKPVIVSEMGGLTEVVENRVTGLVVPAKNPEKAAEALEYLVKNKGERVRMGKAARERILNKYDFRQNLEQMYQIYDDSLNNDNRSSANK